MLVVQVRLRDILKGEKSQLSDLFLSAIRYHIRWAGMKDEQDRLGPEILVRHHSLKFKWVTYIQESVSFCIKSSDKTACLK